MKMYEKMCDEYYRYIYKRNGNCNFRVISRIISEYILNRIIKTICYKHIESGVSNLNSEGCDGRYNPKARTIAVDEDLFKEAFVNEEAFKRMIHVALHESRHAWQYEHGWDFSDYIAPDPSMDYYTYVEALRKYSNHKVEVDAEEFASRKVEEIDFNNLYKIIIDSIDCYRSMMGE